MLSENIFEVDICLTCTYYWHIGNIFGNGAFAFRKVCNILRQVLIQILQTCSVNW